MKTLLMVALFATLCLSLFVTGCNSGDDAAVELWATPNPIPADNPVTTLHWRTYGATEIVDANFPTNGQLNGTVEVTVPYERAPYLYEITVATPNGNESVGVYISFTNN